MKQKGQGEVISNMLITGVLIGIVGAVLFWGLPLIQKSRDASTLSTAEDLMKTLSNKIKFVVNNGGKDRVVLNVPSAFKFLPNDPAGPSVQLILDTRGTIYAADADIPLGKNECSRQEGIWGVNEPEVLCLTSRKLDTNRYITTYRLSHILLKTEGVVGYKINMTGSEAFSGEGHTIVFENSGTRQDGNFIYTLVSVNVL